MFKFRRIPEEKVEMEKRKILNRLERMGYKIKEVKDERVCCEKNGKEILIFLEETSNRNKILNHFPSCWWCNEEVKENERRKKF